MSANSTLASSPLASSSANAHSGSVFGRLAQRVSNIKAGDLFTNGLWVAFAAYGLAATINVILTY